MGWDCLDAIQEECMADLLQALLQTLLQTLLRRTTLHDATYENGDHLHDNHDAFEENDLVYEDDGLRIHLTLIHHPNRLTALYRCTYDRVHQGLE